jgi:hypothetical protein
MKLQTKLLTENIASTRDSVLAAGLESLLRTEPRRETPFCQLSYVTDPLCVLP